MQKIKVQFAGFDCFAVFARYATTDNVAIQLFDNDDGVPVCTATVNLDPLEDGLCTVKTYSENAGMDQALISAGIIEPEPCDIQCNDYITAPVYRLTDAALKQVPAKDVSHG